MDLQGKIFPIRVKVISDESIFDMYISFEEPFPDEKSAEYIYEKKD